MTTVSLNNFQPYISGFIPEPVLISDIPEVTVLDGSIFGAERTSLITSLISENPEYSWCIKRKGVIAAFVIGRKGAKYMQIGPVSAQTSDEAMVLISQILARSFNQPLVVDVCAEKIELIDWLSNIGFVRQRDFVRMYWKKNLCPGKPENQNLICGPEFG